MPAAASPLREDARLFNYRMRFDFLHRLFAQEIAAGRVILSILEKKLPQPNYTYNTLEALAQICPVKPVLVIGADQAQNLPRWHKADDLLRNFRFLVFARGGSPADALPVFNVEVVADFDEEISATELRSQLAQLSVQARIAEMQKLLCNWR